MLDICKNFANTTDLKFNYIKSHLMQIGLSPDVILPNLNLKGIELHWVNYLKHFGVVFTSGKKFTVDVSVNCRKF